jgi:transcriptional regulator with XRE-family HTH domain
MAVGGTSPRTRSGINLTAAAQALGVTRRTAERWANGTLAPSARHQITLSVMAVGGTSPRTRSGINLTAAAQALGVSRRTVERWVTGAQVPSQKHAEALEQAAAPTEKRQALARSQAMRGSPVAAKVLAAPATLRISAQQGPSERTYMRNRAVSVLLDPQDAAGMLAAWEQGGDAGFRKWATGFFSENYVHDWQFGDIDDVDLR